MNRPDFEIVPLRPSPDVVSRRIAGERLLMPVRHGAAQIDYLFTSNEAGSAIFDFLDGRRAAAEIARLVSGEFEVAEEQARADVLEFLAILYDAGLALPDGNEPR